MRLHGGLNTHLETAVHEDSWKRSPKVFQDKHVAHDSLIITEELLW